ncbi:MAG: hypothetical protein ACXQT5_07625 [Candidatus Syntropharchaeia archaeon]
MGPVQLALSVFGFVDVEKRERCMLLSTIVACIFPMILGIEVLRDVHYLLVVLPFLSVAGFYYILERGEFLEIWKNLAFFSVLFILFSSLIVIPIVENLYNPQISEKEYERGGMRWLGNFGNPEEKCIGYGYNHEVYTRKKSPSVQNQEKTRFIEDLKGMFFSEHGEKYAKDLHSAFGVKYIISSKRVMRNLEGSPEELKINKNSRLDRIFSSKDGFSIYRYI